MYFTPQVLKGKPTIDGRPGESMEALDFDKLENDLKDEHGNEIARFLSSVNEWSNEYILEIRYSVLSEHPNYALTTHLHLAEVAFIGETESTALLTGSLFHIHQN